MSRLPSLTISIAFIGAGGLVWALTGPPLVADPQLDVPLNPFGIKGSPYGEVFAMALQGPIDTYFNASIISGSPVPSKAAEAVRSDPPPTTPPPDITPATWSFKFENLLTSLNRAAVARTNPKPASEALKRHLRRQAENKLRFANQLDPAHYSNYNSLHFFLTEPEVGTRPELTGSAAQLADDTIRYCLKQEHDPRPALTAAAAATNVLHLMFADLHNPAPKFSTAQMRQYLTLLDQSLVRYHHIADEWDQSQNWDLLSPQRIAECQERLHFIGKIRDAAEQTILRLERKKSDATPPSH